MRSAIDGGMAPMDMFTRDPWGRSGTWPEAGALGLIGLDLPLYGTHEGPLPDAEEPVRWNAWLSRVLGGDAVRFGDRIGSHLWLFADMSGIETARSLVDLEGLARKLRERLLADSDELLGVRAGFHHRADRGYGAAVVAGPASRPFQHRLYEAFLMAASKLSGWGRTEKETQAGLEMERILREGDIRSAYQPIFHLRGGHLYGYEALTRCPKGSLFDGPLALFRFADREGYSFALDRLARETAIRSCPLLGPKQKIFINVNSGIMKDPHFVSGQTRQWLAARGLQPGQVVLELTERDSIDDFEEAKQMLDHYRSQGYEIAIDDAGAGYSSLQAIVELKPDYIKLDKSLVQNADRDEMKLQMLRTFVRFSKRMRIRTVAEGIETPEELQLVRKMGIDFGQGFLIGRPSEHPILAFPAGIGLG
uniref:EAL domain-containing protein n=2 Tax=Cohnella candidum TaxID=2674991 RepID=A0A3G3JTH0_9BACL|nr:EAL domain-containing protein [Cohnella candidum]